MDVDDYFWFTFLDSGDFTHGTFVQWGSNTDLKLVKSRCTE
jgi:hypothetical protein